MYRSHWGLSETPFRNCLDPRFFYESPAHEEALARLHFLAEQRRHLGLLMGPHGSGKSLVLQVFAVQIYRAAHVATSLSLAAMEPADVMWKLLVRLGKNPPLSEQASMLWRRLEDCLAEYRLQQLQTVLLLDDADQASRPTINFVKRLLRYDPTAESRLTVVLAGQSRTMGNLGADLLELADLRIDLEPWNQDDTLSFLKQSLARAGGTPSVFDEPAAEEIHRLAGGLPRRVSQLADLALLAAAGQNRDHVDAELVESAYRELATVEA